MECPFSFNQAAGNHRASPDNHWVAFVSNFPCSLAQNFSDAEESAPNAAVSPVLSLRQLSCLVVHLPAGCCPITHPPRSTSATTAACLASSRACCSLILRNPVTTSTN